MPWGVESDLNGLRAGIGCAPFRSRCGLERMPERMLLRFRCRVDPRDPRQIQPPVFVDYGALYRPVPDRANELNCVPTVGTRLLHKPRYVQSSNCENGTVRGLSDHAAGPRSRCAGAHL